MSRKSYSLFVVIVFAAVAMLLSACGDDQSGGNGCPTSLIESNGQLICPVSNATAPDPIMQKVQDSYSKAVDDVSAAYGKSVQGSVLAKTCGFSGFKPGSMTECNP